MAAVSFLRPPVIQSGHPGFSDPLDEQTFIVDMVNAIEQSQFWSSTAIIIAYDDSDGWYDHVMDIVNGSATPADTLEGAGVCGSGTATAEYALPGVAPGTEYAQGRCGHGPRLPLLVISPWAKQNYIDSTKTDQTSIVRLSKMYFSPANASPAGLMTALRAGWTTSLTSARECRKTGMALLDDTTGEVVSVQ